MPLSEQLLQYIWLHRKYNSGELKTESGEPLQIIAPGNWNKNAGPDFLNGKIKVGNTILAGHIEIHIKTSDWIKHGHTGDEHYQNLILHVVYEADITQHKELPKNVPTLVLKERISRLLLEKYTHLMQQEGEILCADQLDKIKPISWVNWKDRLLVARWQQKTSLFSGWMEENNNDWASTFYNALARNFGLPVNGNAFLAVAKSLPLKILSHYKSKPFELEALLFGQSAMLEQPFEEDYPKALQKEYRFLQEKYQLKPISPYLWKWSRMRPASFPTLRLAQFSALISHSSHLFSTLLETKTLNDTKALFKTEATSYWKTHYRFDKISSTHNTQLGTNMIHNIIINTICPILAMYDSFDLKGTYLDRAFQWMRELPPEKNRLTRKWTNIGQTNTSAWDSQALLHLLKNYCVEKKCLECAIGYQLLRNKR